MLVAAAVLGIGWAALAQTPATQPGGAAPASRSARGRYFSPAQLQQLQDTLQVSDNEWRVILPKIEKIESLRRATQSSRQAGRGRRGGQQSAPVPQTDSPVPSNAESPEIVDLQKASQQLQDAINNKETSREDLKTRIAALREARARVQAELVKTQDEVRDMLTARQEAVLVTRGLLN